MPSVTSTLLYSKLVQILMVSSRDILRKTEFTSRLPKKNLQPRFTISSVKAKESFKVNLLNVIEESLGTKKFASFQLGVPIAESKVLNGGQTSVIALCILQSLHKIPALLPIVMIFLHRPVFRLPGFSRLFK